MLYKSRGTHTAAAAYLQKFPVEKQKWQRAEHAAHLQQLKCLRKPNSFQQISHITGHCVIADGN